MPKNSKARLPVAPLPELIRWWRTQRVPAAVIGGLAVALLGRPRVTRDVDALVILPDEGWSTFVEQGQASGFVARRPDALDFARQNRVLLLRHDATGIDIDVSMGNLPFEFEVVERAKKRRVAGVTVPLATAEDLIVMKAIARRARDFFDIEGLLETHPILDLNRVRRYVGEFAALLEMPEILTDLEQLLARHAPFRRGPKKPKS